MFSREDFWVWDFWLADDGADFHLYYLFAPKSLVDPHLRHRNARIGHATSADLRSWQDHGEVLRPGDAGDFDETATWTGSVVRGDDGLWRMFYTGAVFESPTGQANIESIGVATSEDLFRWIKRPDFTLRADPRWYEKLGDSDWPEEAWRDPWVYRDPGGDGWHMLITARSKVGALRERGVVGHARSTDLDTWEVAPPLSPDTSTFGHLEVIQIAEIDGRTDLVFSASSESLRAGSAPVGGIWMLDDVAPTGPFDIDEARLLSGQHLYSGKVLTDRAGTVVLLAFDQGHDGEGFVGGVSDPIPLRRDDDGRLVLSRSPGPR